jgi:hypothetical protein
MKGTAYAVKTNIGYLNHNGKFDKRINPCNIMLFKEISNALPYKNSIRATQDPAIVIISCTMYRV